MDYLTHYGQKLPEGFVASMRALMPDAEGFLAAMQGKPSVGVRLNPSKRCRLPEWTASGRPVAWCTEGLVLAERPDFTLTPQLHAGAFYVQEPASMVVSEVMRRVTDGRPARVLEVCAAPGGKSTAALAALPEGSMLVANEYMPARAAILRENVVKWGSPDVIVTNTAAERLGRLEEMFDIVMVDAPCSGEGMMRKEAVAVEQWSERLIAQCAALQRDILAESVKALRPGGTLIYSTCTFNRRENEDNAEWIAGNLGLESLDLGLDVPQGFSPTAVTYRFSPCATATEGLFLAAFRKPGEGSARRMRTDSKRRKGGDKLPAIPRWLANPERFEPYMAGAEVCMVPSAHIDLLRALEKAGAKVMSAGVGMFTPKGKDLVPSHSLALSTALADGAFPQVELSYTDACAYLRRDAVAMPDGTPRGYVIVTHGGARLGMVKNLGNRANNLYPDRWKIRYR